MEKKPKLRFKGFTNDWEQRKPNEFLKISKIDGSEGNIAKKLTVKLWGKGIVEKKEINQGSSNTSYYIRHSGQLMYGKLDFLHASFGIVPDALDGYESTSDSPAFDVIDGNSKFLLEYFLRTEFYLKNGQKSNGSRKAKRIHERDFLNFPITVPINNEQNKIGIFIEKIDKTITLHEEKLSQLKLFKKAMLQRMFADKSEYPNVRFNGFTDAWEQRKLEEVAPLRGGFAFKSSNFINNGIPIIRISNILKNGKIGGPLTYYQEQNKDDSYILPDKAALIAMSGATTGKVSVLSNPNNDKIYQNQRVGYFQTNGQYDYGFITTLVGSRIFSRKLRNVLVAGAQPNVSTKDIDSFEFLFPVQKLEQRKIGLFFKDIDSLITLQQRKLDQLHQTKKFLLQNMFI